MSIRGGGEEGGLSAPLRKPVISPKASLTKLSDIFYLAIPLILSLFGAKSDVQVSNRRLRETGTSRRKF